MHSHRGGSAAHVVLIAAALAGVTVLAYLPALHGPFLFDDFSSVLPARPASASPDDVLEKIMGNGSGPGGRPVAVATFVLNWLLSNGQGAFAFKATNLAIHLVNALLVFALGRALIAARAPAARDPRHELAIWLTVAIWTLHPLQVSTVMYVVQRMTLLSATFTLVALLCYVTARRRAGDGARVVFAWFTLSVTATVLACLSKENGVLVPLFVLALEGTVLSGAWANGGRETTVRRIGVRGSLAATATVMAVLVSMRESLLRGYDERAFSLGERLHAQLIAMADYLEWIVLPRLSTMTFYHDHFRPPEAFSMTSVFAAAVLSTLLVVAVVSRKRRPFVALGIAFFLGGHLLESTVVALELVFEHRNYLPMLGIVLAAVGAAPRWRSAPKIGGRSPAMLAVGAVLLGATWLTQQRALTWSDAIVLSAHAVENAPESERAWIGLAGALAQRDLLDDAFATVERAREVLPNDVNLLLQRLRIAWRSNLSPPGFVEEAAAAIERHPLARADVWLLENLVEERVRGTAPYPSTDDLRTLFRAAAGSAGELSGPTRGKLAFHHHRLLLEGGQHEAALEAISLAGRLMPESGEAAAREAETLVLLGRPEDAFAPLQRARTLAGPYDADAAARLDRIEARARGDVATTLERRTATRPAVGSAHAIR